MEILIHVRKILGIDNMNKTIFSIVFGSFLYIVGFSYYMYSMVNSSVTHQSINYSEWCATDVFGIEQCFYSDEEDCENFVNTHDGVRVYCKVNP
jgi:hypothetical protein